MANIPFNPYAITNVQDSFSVQSQGYWQGDLLADPSARFQIAAGVVGASETVPMWGGIAIYEKTPPANSALTGQAPTIVRASNDGAGGNFISGFTTYQGTFAAPVTPSSTAPLQASGGGFNFVRLGSLSRIVVPCSAGVIALAGSGNPQTFTWDPTNEYLDVSSVSPSAIEFKATLVAVNAGNSATVVYNSGTGAATWNTSGNVAVILI
jgi:hypothetical protein